MVPDWYLTRRNAVTLLPATLSKNENSARMCVCNACKDAWSKVEGINQDVQNVLDAKRKTIEPKLS